MEKIKFIDLFAGIGGIRQGFERNGFECVFSSEINQACQSVYKSNYGEKPYGDITQINVNAIPDFDVLCAGFPCQPFSICGKKLGFEDTRGTLFFDICRIAEYKKPTVIFLENVKNLVNHDGGRTFKVILSKLEQLGYYVNYKILNSRDFGVAQSRERIIIVATNRKKFNFNNVHYLPRVTLNDILEKSGDFDYLSPDEYTLIPPDLVHTQAKTGLIFCGYRNKGMWKKGTRPNTEHLSRCHRQPNRIYSTLGVHPTLPSQETSGRFFVYIPSENKVRKLTIRECYSLMGFPANFKIDLNNTNAYKQIGNSVVIPMIQEIAKEIRIQIFKDKVCHGNFGTNIQQLAM